MRPDPLVFADPGRIITEAFGAAFALGKRVPVDEWAAEHRYLSNPGGGYTGRWRHDIAPYLQEPMRCLTGTDYLTVAVVGPGQCGKTSIGENWLLSSVDTDPGNMLWYMPAEDGLKAYVKQRIEPMLDAHPQIKNRLGGQGDKDRAKALARDNTLNLKRFDRMSCEFLPATNNNTINKSAPRLIIDEQDAYGAELGGLKNLLDIRRQTFGRRSKILMTSHPDKATGLNPARDWKQGIMSVYADSTRFTWWWKCPQCGMHSSPNPGTSRYMELKWNPEGTLQQVADSAYLLCPAGCVNKEAERQEMRRAGRWVGQGQTCEEDGTVTGELIPNDTAGFWIMGVMSGFILNGIPGLARAYVEAEREFMATGEDKSLKQVSAKQLCMPYTRRSATSIDAEALQQRADPTLKRGVVPDWARLLWVTADVQGKRFEVLWTAQGERGRRQIVDYRRIPANPALDPAAWLDLVRLLTKPLPIDGMPGMALKPRCSVYDSGGEDGVTIQAYEAWTRARRMKLALNLGKNRQLDCWSLLPSKGGSSKGAPRVAVHYPESRADRKANAKGAVPVLMMNTDLLKDDANITLATTEGDGLLHLPEWLGSDFPDAWDQLTAEERDRLGHWDRKQKGQPNELWDLLVQAHACARLHGVERIDWEKPPAWARALADNSLVVPLEEQQPPQADPQPQASAPVPPPAATAKADKWAAIRRARGL